MSFIHAFTQTYRHSGKSGAESSTVGYLSVLTVLALLVGVSGMSCYAQEESWFEEPQAPGTQIGLNAEALEAVQSYAADQPIVGTYLFYWYDVYSGAHVTYGDGGDACTTHPPSWEDYSFHSTQWWREQLQDITAAGIDFAAPVYWGYPGGYAGWSFQGLPPLVRALDYMDKIGEEHPKIGLFYDTSTLAHSSAGKRIDLSTDDGKAWFYCTIRDFFSFIPPRHWAAIDGKPIILLYASAFAEKQDPALFPYVRERFRADFAVDPYIIKQTSWEGEADNTCNGLSMAGCAALGPGYDHSAVRGRTPLIREREDGAFYTRSWETLLRFNPARRPKLVMVETWNEFHEGTDVAETVEYGRQYIDLTRKHADIFHADESVAAISGPYSDAKSVTFEIVDGEQRGGITVPSNADGLTELVTVEGKQCLKTIAGEHEGKFLYFNLAESFAFDLDPQPVTITIEYFDDGCEGFSLNYDSTDSDGSVRDGAFKSGGGVTMEHTKQWKRATFTVADARFANRANGSDFRLAVSGPGDLTIAGAEVSKGE